MSRNKSYIVSEKKNRNSKNKKMLKGGYVSSLVGISQTDRAEIFKLEKRGAAIHVNKKRKYAIKPKHKSSFNSESCAFIFN